jgi:arylsulfatase A-like enzyme
MTAPHVTAVKWPSDAPQVTTVPWLGPPPPVSGAGARNWVVIMVDDIDYNYFKFNRPYTAPESNGLNPGNNDYNPDIPFMVSMAADGVVGLNARAQPVCSPTRASIFTGITASELNGDNGHGLGNVTTSNEAGEVNEGHFGAQDIEEFGDTVGYDPDMYSKALASLGYGNFCLSGKWHLASPDSELYTISGATVPSGTLGSGYQHITDSLGASAKWRCTFRNLNSVPTNAGGTGLADTDYNYVMQTSEGQLAASPVVEQVIGVQPGLVTDTDYAANAAKWITQRQFDDAATYCASVPEDESFVLHIHTNIGHAPYAQAPDGLINTTKFKHDYNPDGDSANANGFLSQMGRIEALDTVMGQWWNGLTATQQANTNVIFYGDNGGDEGVWTEAAILTGNDAQVIGVNLSNAAQAGGVNWDHAGGLFKRTTSETGVRVPFLAWGPSVTRRSGFTRALIDPVDIPVTIMHDITGDATALQTYHTANGAWVSTGKSFLPALTGAVADTDASLRQWSFTERYVPNGRRSAAYAVDLGFAYWYSYLGADPKLYKIIRRVNSFTGASGADPIDANPVSSNGEFFFHLQGSGEAVAPENDESASYYASLESLNVNSPMPWERACVRKTVGGTTTTYNDTTFVADTASAESAAAYQFGIELLNPLLQEDSTSYITITLADATTRQVMLRPDLSLPIYNEAGQLINSFPANTAGTRIPMTTSTGGTLDYVITEV